MVDSVAVTAARHFLATVWDGEKPDDLTLMQALDRLLVAYHDTPDVGPGEVDVEAPRDGGPSLYQAVGARFPDYGLYAIGDPSVSLAEAPMIGDAIDDLADLTLDLREVVWLADNVGFDDAHWMLRLNYFHWGRHARDLAQFLFMRTFWSNDR